MERPSRAFVPWECNPYRLVRWWDMEVFTATEFYKIARLLEIMTQPGFGESAATRIGEIDLGRACRKLGFTISLAQMKRIDDHFRAYKQASDSELSSDEKKLRAAQTKELVRALQERIQDEMGERLFLFVPSDEAALFQTSESFFAEEVLKKWPNLTEDGSEAAKCFALSRYTASVFHFMRVMEFGVQKLADRLGVKFTQELRWQNILDQVDKAIKALDQKAEETKKLASVSANLYNVKLA